jgi:RHS repeat-associated protein
MHSDACATSVASGNHYKFTGKERDVESGLDYFGARHHSSSVGRFMQIDPKQFRGLAHPFPIFLSPFRNEAAPPCAVFTGWAPGPESILLFLITHLGCCSYRFRVRGKNLGYYAAMGAGCDLSTRCSPFRARGVLLSAMASKPDWLLTHNTRHFTQLVAARTGLRVAAPAEFFRTLSSLFR